MRPPPLRGIIVASQQSGDARRSRQSWQTSMRRSTGPARSRARWRRSSTGGCAVPADATRSACRPRRSDLATRPPRNPLDVGQDALRYAIDAMQRTLLFWDTLRERGNGWIAHERAGKPPLLHNDWEMLADARTFERPVQLRPAAHHSPARHQDRRAPAAVHHHRPACRSRPGHRRLQEGLRGRRGAARRPPGVLRHLLPRPRAGTDACRRRRRRGRVRAHRRRAPSRQPEARAGRQLPGRLGGDDACRIAPRHRGSVRDQRRADFLLGRQRRRKPDALPRRTRRRRMAGAVRQRPRRRQVRRRAPRRATSST